MQIAFWSPVHGQTATTANTVAITCALALEQQSKILLTHNHHKGSTLETCFLGTGRERSDTHKALDDTGIDGLGRFIRFNAPDEDSIRRYMTPVIKNHLDILTGTKQVSRDMFMKDQDTTFLSILDYAGRFYDMTCVDVAAGDNELSKKILAHSDIVVVNLNQNIAVLDEFFNKEISWKEKSMFLISFYDPQSKHHWKNIKRRYKITQPIGCIPYNRTYADAMGDGRVLEYWMRNRLEKGTKMADPFIESSRKSAQMLTEQIRQLEKGGA